MKTPIEEQRYDFLHSARIIYRHKDQPLLQRRVPFNEHAEGATFSESAVVCNDHAEVASVSDTCSDLNLNNSTRKVELLRIKEEKRGFAGYPVKKHPLTPHGDQAAAAAASSPTATVTAAAGSAHSTHYPTSATYSTVSGHDSHGSASTHPDSHGRRWGPGKRIDPTNIDELLRPNQRNFTTISNSGVTRSERLDGWVGAPIPTPSDMAGLGLARDGEDDESEHSLLVYECIISNDDLAGLEECFRKVCKGNVEVLYSLLPGSRKQHRQDTAGFTVRSYRNPNQAEIMADFTPEQRSKLELDRRTGRPKTVPIRRPIVPQPYFFKHHAAQSSGNASNPGKPTESMYRQQDYELEMKPASPAVGALLNGKPVVITVPCRASQCQVDQVYLIPQIRQLLRGRFTQEPDPKYYRAE